jgi:hypothetical protein
MDSLAEIMARVEQLAFAREAERQATPDVLAAAPSSEAPSLLPLATPQAEMLLPPEYIQAEAFLEVSGYFTPSSNRIKHIYTKEKKIREYVDAQGTRRTVKTKISANHELGLPITSDLDYYRAFLKICDEIVDREGRFRLPIAVPTSTLIRYAGKSESAKEWKEVKLWFERMTLTGIRGAIYRAKKKDFDEGLVSTVFSQVVMKDESLRNGKIADTNYVWLSPWFLSNYYYRYTHPLDFAFYKRLRKPIAKSLYILLENGWYAAEGKPYAKSYRALCEEFLLAHHRYLSDIKQQLDPSHRELEREGFLEQWTYRPAVRGNDYIIVYYAGHKFFHDQEEKAARRQLAEQIDFWQSASASPQLGLIDHSGLLLSDILDICDDPQNTAAYLKIIKDYPEPLIRMALSETKQACLERRITKSRGAYFTDTLKRLTQLCAAKLV